MNLFGKWKDKATEYLDVRVQLLKLKFIERTSKVLSSLMFAFLLLFVTVSVLIFVGLGIMESFTTLFDSRIGGAFATAGVFVLLIIILMGLKDRIMNSFAGIFVRVLTDDPDEEEAEQKQPQD